MAATCIIMYLVVKFLTWKNFNSKF
jgi:hypothetical protein